MGVYPNDYTQEEFKHFLIENEIDDLITKNFEALPETITYNGKEFTMTIRATFFSIGEGFYNYWFNYELDGEMLFEKKIFTDVEEGVEYLINGVGNLK